jgi:DNA repair protein RecN (Recombination protein N)
MALLRLQLRDFVIVRELDLELARGFGVLTGETGAGKSILIDALQLVLGARAEGLVVREGAARAEVSAEFDAPGSLHPWLQEQGFEQEAGVALLLRRVVDAQGKSRAWINGSSATATQLREVADHLVDIHGQHAWQSLTRAAAVRELLDAYGSIDTTAMRGAWAVWREAAAALDKARQQQGSLEQERERLQWQIGELDKLAPQQLEWDTLNAEHTRLSHGQELIDTGQGALEALQGEDGAALSMLSKAQQLLEGQSHIAPELKAIADELGGALAQAEDAAHSLSAYLRKTDLDPYRLQELDERMGLWMQLARRYRRPPAEIFDLLQAWKTELTQLDAATDLHALEQSESRARSAYQTAAEKVSRQRRKAAPQLAIAVTSAMQGIGMQGGRFEVSLEPLQQGVQSGLEDVGFLVAGHPGATPRPVGKVASGGELSRIALAIAVTTSALGGAGTLIFDEVDSGVGGAVAETVGRLLKQLGKDRQVLAVTHLPQVAACADSHWVVSKRAHKLDGKTHTLSHIEAVSGEQRVAEVARMLGGERLSGTTLAHAKELLGQ